MFVRTKTTPNSLKTAVQLVENVRTGNKIKQTLVRHFGYALDDPEIQALKMLALKYKSDLENRHAPALFDCGRLMETILETSATGEDNLPLAVNLKDIKEEKRIKVGIHQTFGKIFTEIGYDRVFKNAQRKRASVRLLRDIVMARIANPASKRSSVAMLENQYGIVAGVNAVYRMMDLLDEAAIDKTQQRTYQYTTGLLSEKINILFYDCTTLYFESFIEGDLKQNGYSKDGKFNQSQVLLAMMVTQAGLPIGYELFEGSTFEGNTLADALKKLHQTYAIGTLIFVADSALLSKDNIAMLQAAHQPFIVGARIKNQNAELTRKILDNKGYQPLYDKIEENQENQTTYCDIAHHDPSLRLIVTHSPDRAAKDKYDREKAIGQLTHRLSKSKNPKALLNNYGYKKFISVQGDAHLVVDEEKIKQARQWDGLHGITTNIKDQTARQLIGHYKGLWQIEETFRISKHDLRMRPIFHWTTKRIRAHIALCFMALSCMRTLEYKVRLQYRKMSPAAIRNTLLSIEVSLLKDYKTGKRYSLPSKATQDAKKIYQLLGLRWTDTPWLVKK